MPATGAGQDHRGAVGLMLDQLHQRLGDLQREFILRRLHAEGAGHAAAAGIEHGHGAVGRARGEAQRVLWIRQRLRMAVGVKGAVEAGGARGATRPAKPPSNQRLRQHLRHVPDAGRGAIPA